MDIMCEATDPWMRQTAGYGKPSAQSCIRKRQLKDTVWLLTTLQTSNQHYWQPLFHTLVRVEEIRAICGKAYSRTRGHSWANALHCAFSLDVYTHLGIKLLFKHISSLHFCRSVKCTPKLNWKDDNLVWWQPWQLGRIWGRPRKWPSGLEWTFR